MIGIRSSVFFIVNSLSLNSLVQFTLTNCCNDISCINYYKMKLMLIVKKVLHLLS